MANTLITNRFLLFNALTFMDIDEYLIKLQIVNRFIALAMRFEYLCNLLYGDNAGKLPILDKFYECL